MSAEMPSLPLDRIETVFLDAGNTLVTIDFDAIVTEMDRLGIAATPAQVERAEAAIRPTIMDRITGELGTPGTDPFTIYMGEILREFVARGGSIGGSLGDAVDDLCHALTYSGSMRGIWSRLLPGIPDALERLVRGGYRLAVVSNSDGTVEEGLRDRGIREYFDAVVDSALLGISKPDPRIFGHALEVSGARAETTMHVGDLYDVDVVGARAAGIHGVLLDPFGDWVGVDCVRFRDVPEIAAALCAGGAGT